MSAKLHELKPLSASSIKTFNECAHKFFLYKTGAKEDFRGSQLVLGSAVHSAIDGFYKKNPKYATPQLAAKKFEGWYRHGEIEAREAGLKVKYPTYGNRPKDVREGAAMVEGFLEHYKDLNVLSSECSFLVNVPLLNGYVVSLEAHIDLVVEEDDGSITLGDVKSGFSKPTPIYLNYDIQMNGYLYAAKYGNFIGGRNQYDPIPAKFDVSKVKRKRIYNVREFAKKDPNLKEIEYTDDSFDEDEFIRSMTYTMYGMEFSHDNGYYAKNAAAIHSSPCNFCGYQTACKNGKSKL